MSLSRPAWPAGPAWPVSSEPPPEDPAAAPPSSKRRRLKEPDGVSEAEWPLLVVPRLSEVEKAWEWSLRPFTAFLIPKIPWSSGGGRQRCDLGCRDRTFQTQSCWQSGMSGRAGCSRAPRRSREAGLQDREAQGVRIGDQAEASHAPPNTPMPYVQGVKQEPEELPEKETILKEKSSARQPGNPFLDVTFSEETKSALHEIKDRCKVDSVITSEKKENVSSSTLKISKFQNQASLESAKPSYFRDSITKNFPEFPRDLNSNMSFVYLKEIAKKKNDKIVAYVRDFTNIFWSQNRPDAKKQKLQEDKKNVYVENDFSYYTESNYQSLTVERKIELISSDYYRPSSTECDVRDSKKNFTLTLEDANWEGTERNQGYDISTRQEKSQSSDYNSSILKGKKQNCWRMKKIRIICETMNKHGEYSNLVRLLLTDLLHKRDYHSVKNAVIGTLCSPLNLIKVVWFNGKGKSVNMLQLGYYTLQKYTSGNKGDSTLACHKMLTCKKQINIPKSGILSKYSQNMISEFLNIILKTNIVSCLDNFDSFIINGDDGESKEGCIFKYIVNLNYLKNIKKRHIVYLIKMLTTSRLLEHSTKSTAKKRKLFKMEYDLEWAKKQNINSLNTKTKSFLIYKVCQNVPLLMDFDNMEELSLTKKPSYENTTCAVRLLNMENLAYYSFGIDNTHVKSEPLFIQNNCGHINEKYYESSMYNQDLDTERKWKNKTIHFIFKFIFEDVFNVRQLGTLLCQNTSHSDQINAMPITLNLSLDNLLSEIEEKIYDFVLKKEMKVTKSSSSCRAHKAIDTEKEEDSSPQMDRMSSVQSASLVSKSINVEETKSVNQNNGTSTKEDGSILQESELANSKHFHPKNEPALYANHQFESDSSGENNECFQGLNAKCLSTETLPVAKEFEMKSKFDLVLEELRMFHEISKENEIPSTMETNNRKENYFGESNDSKEARMEIGKKLEMVETNTRDTPFLPCDVKAGLNKHKRHQSLFHWKIIPTHVGQAVPNECCPRSEEELLHSTSEEDYKKPLPKSSTFSSDEHKSGTLLKRAAVIFRMGFREYSLLRHAAVRLGLACQEELG
ncbi:RAD51-associated protein 2 [Apodemus speciosus]|uniref:RAD51-associated protein 2 n=1 Tax=Apodemus speciosus TaxID=105296 RepID=A0ABQ0FDH5_APOSI